MVKTSDNFKDTFSADELDSENVSTKEAKVAFLQKSIDSVGQFLPFHELLMS